MSFYSSLLGTQEFSTLIMLLLYMFIYFHYKVKYLLLKFLSNIYDSFTKKILIKYFKLYVCFWFTLNYYNLIYITFNQVLIFLIIFIIFLHFLRDICLQEQQIIIVKFLPIIIVQFIATNFNVYYLLICSSQNKIKYYLK